MSAPSGGGVHVRAARADDAKAVAQAVAYAAAWRPSSEVPSVEDVLADGSIARYVEGWPRTGDLGFVAVDDDGAAAGAAWWRYLTADEPGYGFVAADVPEVSIGVRPEHRGRGVGTALMESLLGAADEHGLVRLSLSVEPDNPARRLYERLGFEPLDASAAVAPDDEPGPGLTLVRHRPTTS